MTRIRLAISVAVVFFTAASPGCTALLERTYSGPNNIHITYSEGPLPENAFRAEFEMPFSLPKTLKAAGRENVHVIVRNVSDQLWPAGAESSGRFRVDVGNHWLDEHGNVIDNDDGRSPLPFDLKPSESAEVLLTITAPRRAGNHILEIDAVQEGVLWFAQKGSQTFRRQVTVE